MTKKRPDEAAALADVDRFHAALDEINGSATALRNNVEGRQLEGKATAARWVTLSAARIAIATRIAGQLNSAEFELRYELADEAGRNLLIELLASDVFRARGILFADSHSQPTMVDPLAVHWWRRIIQREEAQALIVDEFPFHALDWQASTIRRCKPVALPWRRYERPEVQAICPPGEELDSLLSGTAPHMASSHFDALDIHPLDQLTHDSVMETVTDIEVNLALLQIAEPPGGSMLPISAYRTKPGKAPDESRQLELRGILKEHLKSRGKGAVAEILKAVAEEYDSRHPEREPIDHKTVDRDLFGRPPNKT